MTPTHFTDQHRRARLVARHHLAGTAADVDQAVRDLVVVHSSDPVTPHLAMWARIAGFATDDLDKALYEERTLWRLHAMRRTLWVVAADEATTLDAAVGRKIAAAERKRVTGWLGQVMAPDQVEGWLASTRADVLAALGRGHGERTAELTELLPALGLQVSVGGGKWAAETPISTRLLYVLSMELDVVRGRPKGSWRGSQYRWAAADAWFAHRPDVLVPIEDEAEARARLAARYLERFGPATAADLKWWTGWTVPQTTEALAAVNAVAVHLDRRGEAWVLPGDDQLDPIEEAGVVTLLPGLDPTPMGWQDRRFCLGPHGDEVFDSNGNIGPTVWVDGRIVGGWIVRPDGVVVTELLEDVGAEAFAEVAAQANRLQLWLAGGTVTPRFPSNLVKRLAEA